MIGVDWEKIQTRFEAWWKGELINSPLIQITAPRNGVKATSNWNGWGLAHNHSSPEEVICEFEKYCRQTCFIGEAFPQLLINLGPGIVAAYLGSLTEIKEDTVWFHPDLQWQNDLKNVRFDPDNKWWNITKDITLVATEMSCGKFFVGMTDLGGSLDILASLRGTQGLLTDLVDEPEQVTEIINDTRRLWFKYYEELNNIIQKKMAGTCAWMGIWSPKSWSPLQCDLSAMFSPMMFEEFVAPDLEEMCRKLDHTIYHMDGPEQLPHLEHLLEIPGLDGIQWTSGAANEGLGSPRWFPLYKRIQEKEKLLVLLGVPSEDVERIATELSPKGLFISTQCSCENEAEQLLRTVDNLKTM